MKTEECSQLSIVSEKERQKLRLGEVAVRVLNTLPSNAEGGRAVVMGNANAGRWSPVGVGDVEKSQSEYTIGPTGRKEEEEVGS